MTEHAAAEAGRSGSGSRLRSRIGLAVLGAGLAVVGLVIGNGGLPGVQLFTRSEGVSEGDWRLMEEVKALGGEAKLVVRSPRLFNRFGPPDRYSFTFRGKGFGDASLEAFLKKYGDRVWGIGLTNTSVTDDGLRFLVGLPSIENLAISNASLDPRPAGTPHAPSAVTDAGLVHLRGLRTLKNLTLSDVPVTDAGLDAIENLPDLGGLYLYNTQVRGAVLGRLQSLPKLAVLYLDGSPVTDESLGALKGAANLQALSLVGVPATSKGLAPLGALPRLRQLDVKGTKIAAEEIKAFRDSHPNVQED